MTYLVILADPDGNVDWRHPMEVEATDKADARNAIAESCPAENIRKVLTEQEYKAILSNKNNRARMNVNMDIDDDKYSSGKDFYASMLKAATEQGSGESQENLVSTNTEIVTESQPVAKKISIPIEPPKYFTDNGVMFKIENGILYKKCWESVSLTETTDEKTGNIILPEYRIINTETGKEYKTNKYTVQHLVWKELNNA